MPSDIKNDLDLSRFLAEAARRRVSDVPFQNLSSTEIDEKANFYLTSAKKKSELSFQFNRPYSSSEIRSFLKDSKFFIGTLSSQANYLDEEIEQLAEANLALLDDMQREIESIKSDIREEEIKSFGGYSEVHHNEFARPRDGRAAFANEHWNLDYKTSLNFMPENEAEIVPNVGVTLPVMQTMNVPIKSAVLVSEDTDFGDSSKPIASTNPNNILLPKRVFRHVVIHREYDDTSRLYEKRAATCALMFELASIQLVNQLEIKPVGSSPVEIESIKYVTENGEEKTLATIDITGKRVKKVLFEPIRTRFIKVKFVQNAPITSTDYTFSDPRVARINDILESAGFSQLLDEKRETVKGTVFDFSFERVKLSLRTYNNLGFYKSKPIPVQGPIGIKLNDKTDTISVTSENRLYGVTDPTGGEDGGSPTPGTAFVEKYLGVNLKNQDNGKSIRELIPVPDGNTLSTREWLPIFGLESRLKLFPDFMYGAIKTRIDSAVYDSSAGEWTCTVSAGHGLTPVDPATSVVGDLCVFGGAETGFNGIADTYVVTSSTEFTIKIKDQGVVPVSTLTKSDLPFIYFYKQSDVSTPLSVYKHQTLLTLGTDYELSIDGGSTWLTELPAGTTATNAAKDALAGNCRIKFTNPDYNSQYWVDYNIQRNQALSSDKTIKLRNGKVVFNKFYRKHVGSISSVIIIRSDSNNRYTTPVLRSYNLKIREYKPDAKVKGYES